MGVRRFALLFTIALLPACGGQSHPVTATPPAGGGETSGEEALVSWTRDLWPIVVVRCQLCHTVGSGTNQVPNMPMTDSSSLYLAWVDVFAQCNPNLFRVLPGHSDLSFVYNKVSQETPLCGARMPAEGPPLDDSEQHLLQLWIDQGARHN